MARRKALDDKLPEGVEQLPSGLYMWRVTAGYRNGKQVKISGTAATITKAKQERAKAIADRGRGVLAIPDTTTVRDYATRWLERKKNLATNSRNRYMQHLETACKTGLGDLRLQSVRAHHIKDALSGLADQVMNTGLGRGRVMSAATLVNIRMLLRAVFKEAHIDGVLATNPADGVRRVKPLKTEHPGIALDFPEAAQFHALGETLYAAGVCRLWPALFTAAAIGLRRGEVMALRWCDVDLERGEVRVRQNLTAPNGVLEIGATKTDGSMRDILIPDSLKAVLERQRAAMLEEAQISGETLRADGPVFATHHGGYGYPEHLNRALKWFIGWARAFVPQTLEDGTQEPAEATLARFRRRCIGVPEAHRSRLETVLRDGATLPAISPHDLRHTAGTLMLRRGVPIEVVSKTLGHKDITVTYKVYRHVLESEKRAHVVDLFAALPVAAPVSVAQVN
jgi:integrase